MSRKVITSSAKMAVATFTSRILGLAREQLMAMYFGAGGITDAFLVAYRIPNLLRDLFAEGAFSSAFVPIFTEVSQKDEKAAKGLLWSLMILLGIVTSIISLFAILYSDQIIAFVSPKFVDMPEIFAMTSGLTKVMAPFLLLVSLAALVMGSLNTLKMFFIPSLAPAFFNIAFILCIVIFAGILPRYGIHPVYSMGIGVLFGGLFQFLVQLPLLIRRGYSPQGPIQLFGPQVKKILGRLGIGTIGIAAAQINILVNTILATSTVLGAVSWLTYAFRLFQFPVGMLGVSIAGSNLVHFSDAWKKGEQEEAVACLKSSYQLLMLVLIPASILLYVFSNPAVSIVFRRGAFAQHDAAMTSLALRCYLYGLPFYGIYKVFAPTFYILDRPHIPVFLSIFSVLANIVFSLILTPKYGFHILALGTGLAMFINTLGQTIFLRKYLRLNWKFFFDLRILKIILAGTATFFASSWSLQFYDSAQSLVLRLTVLCGLGALGLATYLATMVILGDGKLLRKFWNTRRKKS